jgi:hypothetical protein
LTAFCGWTSTQSLVIGSVTAVEFGSIPVGSLCRRVDGERGFCGWSLAACGGAGRFGGSGDLRAGAGVVVGCHANSLGDVDGGSVVESVCFVGCDGDGDRNCD